MGITLANVLKTAETVATAVESHEGLINAAAGFAGILPEVAYAEKFLPIIIADLQFLQQETGKSLPEVFTDLVSHLSPGGPNAPALSGPPTDSVS